jgi:UDP-N-acetyl-D-mannosaminuronic acid transferase (WecB/TagA/CpsF family)
MEDLRRETIEPAPSIQVLGVRVRMVQTPAVLKMMEHWIEQGERCHYIPVTTTHGVMEAHKHGDFNAWR